MAKTILNCSRKDTVTSTSAVIGTTTYISLWLSIVILKDLCGFCRSWTDMIKWGCNGDHLACIPQVFKMSLISPLTARMPRCFLFSLWSRGKEKFQRPLFDLPHCHSSHPQAKEPVWRFFQLPNMSILVIHSETRETTLDGWWVHWTHCKPDPGQNSIYYQSSICSFSSRGAVMTLWMPRYQCQVRTCIQQSSKCLNCHLSPWNKLFK